MTSINDTNPEPEYRPYDSAGNKFGQRQPNPDWDKPQAINKPLSELNLANAGTNPQPPVPINVKTNSRCYKIDVAKRADSVQPPVPEGLENMNAVVDVNGKRIVGKLAPQTIAAILAHQPKPQSVSGDVETTDLRKRVRDALFDNTHVPIGDINDIEDSVMTIFKSHLTQFKERAVAAIQARHIVDEIGNHNTAYENGINAGLQRAAETIRGMKP